MAFVNESDAHAARVVSLVLDVLTRVEAGEASVPMLQAQALTAAGALDGTHAELRRALERLENDLERAKELRELPGMI